MSVKTYSSIEPERVQYMQLPDRPEADIWLHKNIQQIIMETEEESANIWEADEVYFRAEMAKEEVEENFESLFESGGPIVETELEPQTLEERVAALEEAVQQNGELLEYVAKMADVDLDGFVKAGDAEEILPDEEIPPDEEDVGT